MMEIAKTGEMIPKCAICKCQVELFTVHRDEYRLVTVYTAQCHGQTQTTELTDVQMMEMNDMRFGEAFAVQALTGKVTTEAKPDRVVLWSPERQALADEQRASEQRQACVQGEHDLRECSVTGLARCVGCGHHQEWPVNTLRPDVYVVCPVHLPKIAIRSSETMTMDLGGPP